MSHNLPQPASNEHALIRRINRKLAHVYERLCTAREGSRLASNVGRVYILDTWRNAVIYTHVDPEDWGMRLGVIPAPPELVNA